MKFCSLIVFALLAISADAQKSRLSGQVVDSSENKAITDAVVSLLRQRDSIFVDFVRTDSSGGFQFKNIIAGQYIILISFPSYADFVAATDIDGVSITNLKKMSLTRQSKLLQEVIVRSRRAIQVKGDTTEFVADSFNTKQGANVEDLLKVIPGIQVDNEGGIIVQGKKVGKVLVDGEEFFSEDPTIATRNLPASFVDKVQVYDSKSIRQSLLGLSNESQEKTINLTLKADKKKGYFGKLAAGTDFSRFSDIKGLYNNFVDDKKVSVYVTNSNVSAGNLNASEEENLGINNTNSEYDEIAGVYSVLEVNDEFNQQSIQGLPQSTSIGGLYADKWGQGRHNFNSDLNYNRLRLVNTSTNRTQYILPTQTFFSNRLETSENELQKTAMRLKYNLNLDSLNSIQFSTAGNLKSGSSSSTSLTEYLSSIDTLTTTRQFKNWHLAKSQLDNSLVYRRLFSKKNRTLVASFRYAIQNDDQQGQLYSILRFHDQGISKDSIVDQARDFNATLKNFNARITYNEPLSAAFALVGDYGINKSTASSERYTYGKALNGKYEALDSIYSNTFQVNAFAQTGNIAVKYIGKKLKSAIGGGFSSVGLNLKNKIINSKNLYNYINFAPRLQMSYALKPTRTITFNYQARPILPTIDQLQPLRNNVDPLNVYIGNPELNVAFNHAFTFRYFNFKFLNRSSLIFNSGYNIISKDISSSAIIDSTGKKTFVPLNVDGNRNWFYWTQWNTGGKSKKLRHIIQLSGAGGRNYSFTNLSKNRTDYSSFSVSYGISYSLSQQSSFSLLPKLAYNRSKYSIGLNKLRDYVSYGGTSNLTLSLGHEFYFDSELFMEYGQPLPGIDRKIQLTVLNTNLSKKVFKNKSGKIIALVNDVFNQNVGFNRFINSNIIMDYRYSKVARYFLLKFEWSFSKSPINR